VPFHESFPVPNRLTLQEEPDDAHNFNAVRCVVAAVLSGCGGDASPKPPKEATQPVQISPETYAANTQFALTMLQQLDDPAQARTCAFRPCRLRSRSA
jgi:hypothetical protein